jgi:hypothetical protein
MATAVRRFLMNSVERTTFMTALKEKAWRRHRKPYPAGDAPEGKNAWVQDTAHCDWKGLLFVRQGRLEGYSSHPRGMPLGCRRGHLIRHSIEVYRVEK